MIDRLLGDLELPGKLGLANTFFFQQLLDAISHVCYPASIGSQSGKRRIFETSNFVKEIIRKVEIYELD